MRGIIKYLSHDNKENRRYLKLLCEALSLHFQETRRFKIDQGGASVMTSYLIMASLAFQVNG